MLPADRGPSIVPETPGAAIVARSRSSSNHSRVKSAIGIGSPAQQLMPAAFAKPRGTRVPLSAAATRRWRSGCRCPAAARSARRPAATPRDRSRHGIVRYASAVSWMARAQPFGSPCVVGSTARADRPARPRRRRRRRNSSMPCRRRSISARDPIVEQNLVRQRRALEPGTDLRR